MIEAMQNPRVKGSIATLSGTLGVRLIQPDSLLIFDTFTAFEGTKVQFPTFLRTPLWGRRSI
jgi:hypothetical protein